MSDYTKTTDFTAKDALPSGDPAKVAKGSEVDTEFDNIETAIATKANKTIPAVTNNVAELSATGDLVDSTVTDTELKILDGATLSTAELNLLDGATLSTAELNLLDGATTDNATINKAAILSDAGQLTLNPASGNSQLNFNEGGTSRAFIRYDTTFNDLQVYTTNGAGTYTQVAAFEGEKNNAGLFLQNDAPATPVANVLYQDNICKAWASVNVTPGPVIEDDFNISSITWVSTGVYDVYFATAMASGTYAVAGAGQIGTGYGTMVDLDFSTRSATTVRLVIKNNSGSYVNSDFTFMVIGDQ